MKKKLKLIKLEMSWLSCEPKPKAPAPAPEGRRDAKRPASERSEPKGQRKHMLSFKMTTYHPYKVNLSKGQKDKLGRAFKANSAITLRLSAKQTSGNDELMLTANQKKRIAKAAALGKGVEIKISKTQIRKVVKQGGSLFSAIIPLARSFAPTLAKNTWTFQLWLVWRVKERVKL